LISYLENIGLAITVVFSIDIAVVDGHVCICHRSMCFIQLSPQYITFVVTEHTTAPLACRT